MGLLSFYSYNKRECVFNIHIWLEWFKLITHLFFCQLHSFVTQTNLGASVRTISIENHVQNKVNKSNQKWIPMSTYFIVHQREFLNYVSKKSSLNYPVLLLPWSCYWTSYIINLKLTFHHHETWLSFLLFLPDLFYYLDRYSLCGYPPFSYLYLIMIVSQKIWELDWQMISITYF